MCNNTGIRRGAYIKWLQTRVGCIHFLQWMRILPYRWYKCELNLASVQAEITGEQLGIGRKPEPTDADIKMISDAVKATRGVLDSLKDIKEGSNGSAS